MIEHERIHFQEHQGACHWWGWSNPWGRFRGGDEADHQDPTQWYVPSSYPVIVDMSNTNNAENRQTMLFSATQTTKVTDLARISLRPGPLYINVDSSKEASTVDMLEQGYVVCDSDQRFMLLFTFLKKNLKKKVIVFFSSCNSVKYHAELLNYIDVPVLDLHVSSILIRLMVKGLMGRENKNNKNEQTHSLNSVMPQLVSYSVQT